MLGRETPSNTQQCVTPIGRSIQLPMECDHPLRSDAPGFQVSTVTGLRRKSSAPARMASSSVSRVIQGSRQDEVRVRLAGPHATAQLRAFDARHEPIANNHVSSMGAELSPCCLAVRTRHDCETKALDSALQQQTGRQIVFCNQNPQAMLNRLRVRGSWLRGQSWHTATMGRFIRDLKSYCSAWASGAAETGKGTSGGAPPVPGLGWQAHLVWIAGLERTSASEYRPARSVRLARKPSRAPWVGPILTWIPITWSTGE
jgi:hypothetical protein